LGTIGEIVLPIERESEEGSFFFALPPKGGRAPQPKAEEKQDTGKLFGHHIRKIPFPDLRSNGKVDFVRSQRTEHGREKTDFLQKGAAHPSCLGYSK